jgi:ribose/xylose/arabinose/galactoside ABC-type transport system permease subunit/ABC-type sugar transport system substrate-binding protein
MSIDRRNFIGLLAYAAVAPAFAAPARLRTVALLFDSLVSPFWVSAIEQLRVEIARRGWASLEAVSNLDDDRQYTQVQSMIQRGVDGIVIVQTDNKAVIPAIRAANAAGVPMVHFNRPPAINEEYSVAVVADNRKLMDDTVTSLLDMARLRGGSYKAAFLLGDLGDANAVNRRDGFQDAVERHKDIVEVVARVATEWNADKAFAGLSNVLQAHPDINLVVASSDFLAPQVEQALRVAGKWHPAGDPGHVMIAGFDGDDNGYAALASGYYDVDGVQDLDREIDLALGALTQMWRGERPPKTLIDPGFVISRETLLRERQRMWGYNAWKAKNPAVVGEGASPIVAPSSSSLHGASAADAYGGPSIAARGFFSALFSLKTLHDVFLTMLPLAILVAGQTMVLIIGQIDLSMTAVLAIGSVVGASVMSRHVGGTGDLGATFIGIGACLGAGAVIGFFNGLCVAMLRMPSFIVTLAVMMMGSGAAVWYASTISDTVSIGGLPEAFRFIGYGTVTGVPIVLLLSGSTLIVIHYMLSRTVAGRWLYALGHNTQVARISGVPISRVLIATFTAAGLCAALASIIYTSRVETGLPTLGQNLLLDIVGAAVIGGVSLFGGRGSVWMALGGVALLSLLDKLLQLLGFSLFLVLSIKGLTILMAAGVDILRRRQAHA